MTTRQMTPKGFLHKTTTKAAHSASAFLAAHRDFLVTGELASVCSPILRKVDEGTLMPTPALHEIAAAVMGHIVASDIQKAEAAIEGGGRTAKQKPWLATVFNSKREIQTRINEKGEVEDLVKGFDDSSSADRWSERRLFDGAVDWFAVVTHTTLKVETVIERLDAIARILKQPKGPAIHTKGVSTKSLGFGVRVKGDHHHFSKG